MILLLIEQIIGLVICSSFFVTLYFYVRFRENKRTKKRAFSPMMVFAVVMILASNLFYLDTFRKKTNLGEVVQFELFRWQLNISKPGKAHTQVFCGFSESNKRKYFVNEKLSMDLQSHFCDNKF